jgi:hypothetical protein
MNSNTVIKMRIIPITALETLFFRFAWMTGDEASTN